MTRYSIIFKYLTLIAGILVLLSTGGCSKSESYSEMLADEEHAVNWFLSGERVEVNIPDDGNFIVGEDAPYYRIEEEGNVYMQVIKMGDMNYKWKKDDKVYFRFMRYNIKNMYEDITVVPEGNADNLSSSSAFFLYKNTTLSSTTDYGEGIQLPLQYLGNNCEVNLVVKSYQGFTSDQSNCIPYKYNIRYFKAVY